MSKSKATSGFFWSAVERFGAVGCSFIVQLILARLLLPEQFGLVAMVAVFVAISNSIVDSGFANAIIQKKNLSEADISTALVFNVGMGLLVASLLWLAAPGIAGFYGKQELVSLIRWLSLSLVLGGCGGVHQAILTRNLEFKKITLVSTPSTLGSGIIGIGMAYEGFGVWALVGQVMTQQALRSLLLWCWSDWRPRERCSFQSFKGMFPYGSRLALSGVLNQGFDNLYVLVIGKFFSPVDVGLFQRAQSFQQFPAINVQTILGRVLFPIFSELQDDPVRLRRTMRLALQAATLAVFPVMALMAVLAAPMVTVLIGAKWLPAADLLRPLCLVGALYPLHAINLSLLMALGRSDAFFKLEVIKKILIVVNIVVTYRLGLLAMIYGMGIMSVLTLFLNTWYSKKLLDYGVFRQCADILRIFIIGMAVFVGVGLIVREMNVSPWYSLLIGLLVGGIIFMVGFKFINPEIRGEFAGKLRQLPVPMKWMAGII